MKLHENLRKAILDIDRKVDKSEFRRAELVKRLGYDPHDRSASGATAPSTLELQAASFGSDAQAVINSSSATAVNRGYSSADLKEKVMSVAKVVADVQCAYDRSTENGETVSWQEIADYLYETYPDGNDIWYSQMLEVLNQALIR